MNDSYCDRSQSSLDNISSNSSKNSSPKSQCTYAGILKGSKKDILTGNFFDRAPQVNQLY